MRGNLKNRVSKNELIDWLGRQPIQQKTNINNIDYALAHAYFDDDLYQYDKNFNLEKGLQLELDGRSDNNILNKFRTVMWYRERDSRTKYSEVTFPDGCLMVVGHTPQREINLSNFESNANHQVIYVDTGNGKFQGSNLSKVCSLDFENQVER